MPPISVMSANLWADRVAVDGFAALLDRVDPDVLAVQELQRPAAEVIADRFDHHGLFPHHDTLGTGIATRRAAAITPLPMTYRSGWTARLDPGDWPGLASPMTVLCVHFGNPVQFPWWRSVDRRRRRLADVLPLLDAVGSLVVVGDLNATPLWPLYRRLAERLDDDPARLGIGATWGWRGLPPMLRIDHALTRGVVMRSAATHHLPGSDHRALVVEVEPVPG